MDQKMLCIILMIFLAYGISHGRARPAEGPLRLDYYDKSCPNLGMVVRWGVWAAFKNDTRIAASLLRLHFHDCFVDGEKNAFPNRNSARGFELIDSIKADVEKYCPSIVSCVHILAIAAREAVVLSGGPFWPVAVGRLDGVIASEKSAFEPLQNITAKFLAKGIDAKDMVVLSGIFNYKLLSQTLTRFDNVYYKNILNNSTLLESDQALIANPKTAAMVNSYSADPFLFARDFAASMMKLGNIGVLTGKAGQVRNKCGLVN